MANREFDIVVLGATGFTGQLVVEYLANKYGVDGEVKWAIAGRNRSKLEAVRAANVPEEKREALHIIEADSTNAASLNAMAQRTRVVCTTVGPYAKYGTPVVEACVKHGTDYCDLTGEVQWMARVISEHQATAELSGARIVHTCGFDSIPFDMGNWFLQQCMQEQYGAFASQVRTRVGKFSGAASGGTIASMLNMMEEMKADPSLRKVMANPYALYPSDCAVGNDVGDQTGPLFDAEFDSWTAPFIMAAVNTRVVRRSNALLGLPWGQDFRYTEGVLTSSRLKATAASAGSVVGMVTMAIGPTRKLAQRFLPKPGEGPTREQREAGFYEVYLVGIGDSDRGHDTFVKVTGDMDPGYGSTAKMLAESALCLAKDELTVKGGFWTPASAMQGKLLTRLTQNAGLTFEQLDGPPQSV
ncbi:MAG: trans-acting enoyl reductase family protein [Halioglobus sp.]